MSDCLLSIESGSLGEVFDALLRIEDVYQDYRLISTARLAMRSMKNDLQKLDRDGKGVGLNRVSSSRRDEARRCQKLGSTAAHSVYDNILTAMHNMGDEMDAPALYNDKDEEGLRDYLLLMLVPEVRQCDGRDV